ncbi:tripartite tricarboxylate transporter permease [Virgibacillus necropolis]|uniref:C4-dicarboxylate ABC transporter permease n=1 Tax=Virgibacillus necropolis TaxID=163877 RepID=A0A221M9V5_9BACI|nr:tripartite tricarboxylate transporter permease [Virgibacillus necropolis]ASN04390.1 C4-dicarboxylate ABC transporter permease [Virgibacillus necropolis]
MDAVFEALLNTLGWYNILIIFIGAFAGIIVGCIPGFNASVGVALTIPLTFSFPPDTGLILLVSIYAGAIYGGSIAAILINTPGEPGNIITAMDGYNMTKQGLGSKALGMAAIASWIGGTISAIFLFLVAPPLSKITLMFGPFEMFLLAIFGLSLIVGLSKESLVKGLISGGLGVLFATVGIDTITGTYRYTFETPALYQGISLVGLVIGLYSLGAVFELAETKSSTIQTDGIKIDRKHLLPTWKDIKKTYKTIIRSGVIGTFAGITPGAGMSIGSAISWDVARRGSKNPDNFGKGEIEGLAASESGNNGVVGGSLIPLITLGIPGNSVSAIFLGGLLIHGLRPGAELFTTHATVTYGLIWGFVFANFVMIIIGLSASRFFAKLAVIPVYILAPLIFVISTAGTLADRNLIFDVAIMLAFGILGYFLIKVGIPLVPLVLGFILGPIAESEMRRALLITQGDVTPYLTEPIAILLIVLIILSLFGTQLKDLITTMFGRKKEN